MKFEGRQTTRQFLLYIFAVSGAAVLLYSGLLTFFGERVVPTAFAQQDLFLSRRIDQIEQRFYTLESRMNRIEQDSRRPSVGEPRITDSNAVEIQFLRTQLDSMRIRLGEAECGLLHIDERTLTPAARQARKKSVSAGTDNCRLDAGSPVQLSARP